MTRKRKSSYAQIVGLETATARASDVADVYSTFRAAADHLYSQGYRYDRERLAWLHASQRPRRIERREGERSRGRGSPREPSLYVVVTLPDPRGKPPPTRI
jgi:dihydroxyacetone kinase